MFKYITIKADTNNCEISALIDENNNYYSPSFSFKNHWNKTQIWDNEKYLIDVFYPKLINYKNRKEEILKELKLEEFEDDYFIQECLEIFEEAFKIGIFKRE